MDFPFSLMPKYPEINTKQLTATMQNDSNKNAHLSPTSIISGKDKKCVLAQ
jgi:hypothetical protein